jgi:hypothetical protein
MAFIGVHPSLLKWMYSFSSDRRQRDKIGNVVSHWSTLNGGMLHGTWLGPYVFLILKNEFEASVPTVKAVDDVTMVKTTEQSGTSHMQTAVNDVATWSAIY